MIKTNDVNALLTTLRERYACPSSGIPVCSICGSELSIVGITPTSTTYACSGQEPDPDRPGHIRYKPGRFGPAHEGSPSEFSPGGHYHDSQWVDRRPYADCEVVALVEIVERAMRDSRGAGQLVHVPQGLLDDAKRMRGRRSSLYRADPDYLDLGGDDVPLDLSRFPVRDLWKIQFLTAAANLLIEHSAASMATAVSAASCSSGAENTTP